MNTVLYTIDFEPITVVDLPKSFLDTLEAKGHAYLIIKDTEPVKRADLYCGSILWPDGSMKPIVVTRDEETALLLKCDWLPGQVGTINILKRNIRKLMDKVIKRMRGD